MHEEVKKDLDDCITLGHVNRLRQRLAEPQPIHLMPLTDVGKRYVPWYDSEEDRRRNAATLEASEAKRERRRQRNIRNQQRQGVK